jgi:hypothetical protein
MTAHRPSLLALVLSTTLVALAVTTPATAAVPEQLHYQGVLQNSAGEPIHCPDLAACPDGLPDLTFRLYDQAEGGAAIWEETQADVSIHHGHFQVVLGATSPVGVELLQGSTYLGVEVETAGEMSPRQAVVSTPYALRAQAADNLGGLPASEYVTTAVLPEICVTPEDLPGLLAELEPGALPGDGDTLATLSCLPNAIAVWNGAFWDCHDHLADYQGHLAEYDAHVADYLAHAQDPDAHHPADSAGLAIKPTSVAIDGGDTQLKDGHLDLGPGAHDHLDAAMVNTLTGGGEADALHTHAGLGAGGVCYTVWGKDTCGEGFSVMSKGRMAFGGVNMKLGNEDALGGAASPFCLDEIALMVQTGANNNGYAESANGIGWYPGGNGNYQSMASILSGPIESPSPVKETTNFPPCALCCK